MKWHTGQIKRFNEILKIKQEVDMATNTETITHCWLKLTVDFYECQEVDYLMSYYGSDYIFLYELLFSEAVKTNKTNIDTTCINQAALKYYDLNFIKEALLVFQKLNITKIKNNSIIPKFKKLVFRQRNSPEYQFWRKSVFERDGYVCKMCGQRKQLNAHHVQLWSENEKLRFDISNGITLCVDCHKKLHKERKKTRGR